MHDSSVYMILELCAGGSVDKQFSKGSLPVKKKLQIFLHIARGLQHLHAWNIIHRDLAARNILLTAGAAKISDFGMSRLVSEHSPVGVTASNFGPVKYWAPEAIKLAEYSCASGMNRGLSKSLI